MTFELSGERARLQVESWTHLQCHNMTVSQADVSLSDWLANRQKVRLAECLSVILTVSQTVSQPDTQTDGQSARRSVWSVSQMVRCSDGRTDRWSVGRSVRQSV